MKNVFQELTEFQMGIGYEVGNLSLIGLLGLFGESGEVIDAYLKLYGNKQAPQASILWDLKDAVIAAEKIDGLKKRIRSKDPTVTLPSEDPVISNPNEIWNFDEEIADTLYYLNLLALNRGHTLEDYAQMSLDKVRARSAKSH